jgi:hypothetical protein
LKDPENDPVKAEFIPVALSILIIF